MKRLEKSHAHLVIISLLLAACGPMHSPSTLSRSIGEPPQDLSRIAGEFFKTSELYEQQGIAVVRSPVGGIYLRAKTCAAVSTQVDAMFQYRERVELEFKRPATQPALTMLASGWCEVRLDHIVTPYLANTFWKHIDDTAVDVNCWTHALNAAGVIQGFQVSPPELFTHTLNSSQCRLLSVGEKLLPGDVISIRMVEEKSGAFNFSESHGAVYLTDELWITKNGGSRFDIAPVADVLKLYADSPTNPECAQRTDGLVTKEHLRKCGAVVQAFRCETRDTWKARWANEGQDRSEAVASTVAAALWERALSTRESEGKPGQIVMNGGAFLSKYPFRYVENYYFELDEDVPSAVKNYLNKMGAAADAAPAYDFSKPQLPHWPAHVEAQLAQLPEEDRASMSNKAFEVVQNYLYEALRVIADELEGKNGILSPSDRHLLVQDALLIMGSDKVFEDKIPPALRELRSLNYSLLK